MNRKERVKLVVHDGGREALGRAMLRAFLDHRYEEARALVDRIAKRAALRSVDGAESRVSKPKWIFRLCEATVPDHGKPVADGRLKVVIAV